MHKGDLLILRHVLEKQESIAFSRDGHACGCYFTCKSHSPSTLVELLACPRICPRTHPTQPSQPGMHPSKVALDVPYLEGSPDKGQCSLHSNYCPRNGGSQPHPTPQLVAVAVVLLSVVLGVRPAHQDDCSSCGSVMTGGHIHPTKGTPPGIPEITLLAPQEALNIRPPPSRPGDVADLLKYRNKHRIKWRDRGICSTLTKT